MGVLELDLSLGEFEALATKAARGAGMPWGLAAEAGRAARAAMASGDDQAPETFAAFLRAAPSPCPLRAGLLERDGGEAPATDEAWNAIHEAAAGRTNKIVLTRCALRNDPREALEALAHMTYAPATEESRAKGAGGA